MASKRAKMSMRIPMRLVQRVCVWFAWKQGKSGKTTLEDMTAAFGEVCYARSTVYFWYK